MPSSCQNVQNLIPAYLNRDLEKIDREFIDEHLKTCDECSLDLKESGFLGEVLELGIEKPRLPKDFAENISRLLKAKEKDQS